MRAHWYRKRGRHNNFGDALTPVLFRQLAGIELSWVPAADAELFAIGSIAQRIPAGFTGTVYGTGYMWATNQADLTGANVLAMRGPLSAKQARVKGALLADPGLLVGALVNGWPRRRQRLGVAPHYVDDQLGRRFRGLRIDVLTDPRRVVEQVATCKRIVTSSLHVLIAADALGIESRWEPCSDVVGNGHKFADYAGSYDAELVPHEWRMADQRQVADKCQRLLDAMRSLR